MNAHVGHAYSDNGNNTVINHHLQVEEAIELALETGCRVHGSQEGVTKKEILQFVKKVFNLTEKHVEEAEERSSQQVYYQF